MDLIEPDTKNDPRSAKVESMKKFCLHIHNFLFSFLGEILSLLNETLYSRSFRV
jgi:hypothetical protein